MPVAIPDAGAGIRRVQEGVPVPDVEPEARIVAGDQGIGRTTEPRGALRHDVGVFTELGDVCRVDPGLDADAGRLQLRGIERFDVARYFEAPERERIAD